MGSLPPAHCHHNSSYPYTIELEIIQSGRQWPSIELNDPTTPLLGPLCLPYLFEHTHTGHFLCFKEGTFWFRRGWERGAEPPWLSWWLVAKSSSLPNTLDLTAFLKQCPDLLAFSREIFSTCWRNYKLPPTTTTQTAPSQREIPTKSLEEQGIQPAYDFWMKICSQHYKSFPGTFLE